MVEHPANMDWGDYSTNAGIVTKQKDKVLTALKAEKSLKNIASEISLAGAGFINISIRKDFLINQVNQLLKGDWEKPLKGKKIMVEFAHPNTHKEMHIGHMRTLIVGEALSRIFEANGAKVFRANYQGDIGPHVAKSIWGTQKLLRRRKLSWEEAEKLSLAEKAHLLGEGYVLGNRDYNQNKAEIDALNNQIYQHQPEIEAVYQRTRGWSLEYYDQFYQRFGTKFDRLFFESEVAEKGKEIVLKNIGRVFARSRGAVVFKGEKYGLHTRVFITKDGNPTYEAKDIGLGPLQFQVFNFDRCIHVVANEQAGYFQVVIKALELLDKKFIGREHHLPMGMVNLIGKKISSRTGEIIKVDSLLAEVKVKLEQLCQDEAVLEQAAIGAVKYSILKTNCKQDVVFEVNKSVSLEGNSGPYLQYSFARCRSVLAKAAEQGAARVGGTYREEDELLRLLARFGEAVNQAAEELAPDAAAKYLYDLAQKFNVFYNQRRIAGNRFRLWLTQATAEILGQGLSLLGISAPEKM